MSRSDRTSDISARSPWGSPSRRAVLVGAGTVALASGLSGVACGATAATTNPSGTAMPVGNIPGWNQIIAQDFTTNVPLGGFVSANNGSGELLSTCAAYKAYGTQLGVYDNGSDNTTSYYNTSQTVSTSGSVLDIYLHVGGSPAQALAAAIFPFRPGSTSNSHLYGRWSYTLRSYDATGTNWGAVALLWPTDNEPISGKPEREMDWPEGNVQAVPPGAAGTLRGFFHPADPKGLGLQQSVLNGPSGLWTNWHVFTIEWLPNSLKFFWNGKQYGSTENPWSFTQNVPDIAMKWDLQTGSADASAPAPTGTAHVQLDWVVAYDPA